MARWWLLVSTLGMVLGLGCGRATLGSDGSSDAGTGEGDGDSGGSTGHTGDPDGGSTTSTGAADPGVGTSTGSTTGPPTGKLGVFVERDGFDDLIEVVDLDGTRTPLSSPDHIDGQPTWSPNGTMIAFLRFTNSHMWDVWVTDATGTDDRRLTDTYNLADAPDWSPDGTRIVFSFSGENPSDGRHLWIVQVDTGDLTQLTVTTNIDNDPAWSPTGEMVAFLREPPTHDPPDLHVINADGSVLRNLTNVPRDYEAPAWSPDGAMVTTIAEIGDEDLRLMSWPITGDAPYEHASGSLLAFAWAPDGSRIAYSKRVGDVTVLHVVGADGQGDQRIATDLARLSTMVWSPEGDFIAFSSSRGDDSDGIRDGRLHVIDAAGHQESEVHPELADHTLVRWLP